PAIIWLKDNIQLSSNWQCNTSPFAIANQYTDTTVSVRQAFYYGVGVVPVSSGPLAVLVLFITIVLNNFYKQHYLSKWLLTIVHHS
ncbi:hypothetical protein WN51_12898, partial [Melipona quadrifasciata]